MAYKALSALVLAHIYDLVPHPTSSFPPQKSVTSQMFLKPTKLTLTSEALH